MNEPKRILSLGVGVQSSTLLLMSVQGTLPKLDAAIFADPGWASKATYAYLEYLKPISEAAGIPIIVTQTTNIREDTLAGEMRGKKWIDMPLFTKAPDGSIGMIRRQCTKQYKIRPVRRAVRTFIGKANAAELWIGVSYDEIHRMSHPDVQWLSHRFPLIHDLSINQPGRLYPVGFTRSDCIGWLNAYGYQIPPKSACVACPFHSDVQWMEMKRTYPDEFADACNFDVSVRHLGGSRGDLYVHSSCVPLSEVVFKVGSGGMGLAAEECQGMCGN